MKYKEPAPEPNPDLLFTDFQVRTTPFFEDVLVERFGSRISEEQRMLATPIPVENRISYLKQTTATNGVITSGQLARELDVSSVWAVQAAEWIGLVADNYDVADYAVEYPAIALPLLAEEKQWREQYQTLDEHISANTVAAVLGTSKGWARSTAQALAITTTAEVSPNNHPYRGYKKQDILKLRHVLLSVPLQGELKSSLALEKIIGKDHKSIERFCESRGIASETRRSNHNHRVARFYREDAVIKAIENSAAVDVEPIWDWVTVPMIAASIGRTVDWVAARVLPYQADAQLRRVGDGRLDVCFAPFIIDELRQQSEKLASYETAGTELALKGLARITGHSRAWVQRRLPYVGVEPKTMLDHHGVPQAYYPEETAVLLENVAITRHKIKDTPEVS